VSSAKVETLPGSKHLN